jgi:His/Glu/Gln/Arg/opine family amino acid ABC transporter permease subunit
LSIFEIIAAYHSAFLSGLLTTLKLSTVIWSAGVTVGALLGVMAHRQPNILGIPTKTASFIMGSVPVLVFLFWLHFPLAELGLRLPPFWSASIALSVVNILAVADIVRHALEEFPQEYLVVARISGLTRNQALRHIQFPLIIRHILPALITTQVTMLQATLFASLISVDEIFRTAQSINARIYRPIQIYTALGILFLLVCGPIQGLALFLKHRFGRKLAELTSR